MAQAQNVPLLISASVFLFIFLLYLGVSRYIRQLSKNRKVIEKIKERGEGENPRPSQIESGSESSGIVRHGLLSFFGRLGKRVAPEKSPEFSDLGLKFLRAGFRRKNAPLIFWGVKGFLAILFPAAFLLARVMFFIPIKPLMALGGCIFLVLLGLNLPEVWLRLKIAGRRDRIFRSIPDALDLLVVCVEAGMGLDAAINRVAEEITFSHKELSDELKLLSLELRAGKLRRDALRSMALRIDLEDLNSLVTLLIQTDKFGTSIAQALRVYSDALRTKRYQRAEEIATKLPVKLLLPLIFFIFPSLFVAILGPVAIRVYHVLHH